MKPLTVFILLSISALYITIYGISIYEIGYPSISDYYLHKEIVDGWMDGRNPLREVGLFGNAFPYPPAFHLTIAGLSLFLGIEAVTTFNFFQVFLFVFILWGSYYLVSKEKGEYVGVLSVCLLVSGFAFWDWTNQPIPNGFDALVMPFAVLTYLRGRNVWFIFASVFLVYNHLFYGVFLVAGLFINAVLFNRDKLKLFLWVGLMCMPLAWLYSFHLENLFGFRDGAGQRYLANNVILWNFAYLGWLLVGISLPGLVYFMFKKKDRFELVLLCWVLALIPLWVKVPHRAYTFLAQPLAIIGAVFLNDIAKSDRERQYILIGVFGVALLYILAEFGLCGFDSDLSFVLRELLFTH